MSVLQVFKVIASCNLSSSVFKLLQNKRPFFLILLCIIALPSSLYTLTLIYFVHSICNCDKLHIWITSYTFEIVSIINSCFCNKWSTKLNQCSPIKVDFLFILHFWLLWGSSAPSSDIWVTDSSIMCLCRFLRALALSQ